MCRPGDQESKLFKQYSSGASDIHPELPVLPVLPNELTSEALDSFRFSR